MKFTQGYNTLRELFRRCAEALEVDENVNETLSAENTKRRVALNSATLDHYRYNYTH